MTLELTDAMLGLGSIVRLESEHAAGLYVVLARGAFRPDAGLNEVQPRYLVGPHPYGEAPDQETFPILVSEIVEVVHEGYQDEADTAFVEDLLDQMENGRRTTTRAQQFAEALTAIPDAEVEEDDRAARADPFAELRDVIGQGQGKDER